MIGQTSKLLVVSIFRIVIMCSITITMEEDRSQSLEGKIVGGKKAKISDFPHAVYLKLQCGSLKHMSVICGSSVLNQVILLTAAHCLECEREPRTTAFAGYEDWTMAEYTGAVRKAKRRMSHQRFCKYTGENDIALVLLKEPLPLNNNIKRAIIKITFPDLTETKTNIYVAGWGNIQDTTKIIQDVNIKSVQVSLVPISDCLRWVDNLSPGMMCTEPATEGAGRPAGGDSGSALITSDYQQIGIVSFRSEILLSILVYTNVSYFYPWIRDSAKLLYCKNKITL